MTLRLVLWSIPVVSLTVAFVLIGIRAERLTRDTFAGRVRLAKAGNEALRAVRPELRGAGQRVPRTAGLKKRPAFSAAAVTRPPVLRKRAIPVVDIKAGGSRAAAAG